MLHDKIKRFGGIVDIEVTRDGKFGPVVIQRRKVHNTVVNAGKRQLLRLASGLLTGTKFDQFRIGTSGATVLSSNTNCLSPVNAITTSKQITAANSVTALTATRTLQLIISYPSGAGSLSVAGLEEVAIFNTSGGSCLMRAVYSSLNLTEDDKLKITYSLRIT